MNSNAGTFDTFVKVLGTIASIISLGFNIKVLYTEKINVGVNEIINTNAMLGRIIDQQDSIAQKYIQLTKLDWHSTK